MKKRCASVILAAALIFALLSGCGTSPQPETGEPAVEATVISALLDQAGSGYYPGECVAEGHEILDIVREEDRWQVYLIASVGQYGFCTGHFEEILLIRNPKDLKEFKDIYGITEDLEIIY